MTRLDRRALFATGSAAALLAAVGVSAKPAPTAGGHLRAALSGASRTDTWLAPASGVFMRCAKACIFETLTTKGVDGTLQPRLALSWAGSPDAAVWTLQLDQTARFASGTTLTAGHVVAAFQSHLDILPMIQLVEAYDDETVRFVLSSPTPDFPLALAHADAIVFRPNDDGIEGTGPYMVERFQPGMNFRAVRVPDHRSAGSLAWFDTVEFAAISDDQSRLDAVASNIVDVADIPEDAKVSLTDDLQLIRRAGRPDAVARKTILHPDRLGRADVLDDGQFAVRWWLDQSA